MPKGSVAVQAPRIVCPNCGNDSEFYEVADGVVLTTRYFQNEDGSFSADGDESEIHGEIRLFCGECHADLSQFHQRFREMLF
ncbi:MAG: hypothetical protein AB1634_03480 [Thermodesulfobacteriota bacterium]